MELISNTHDILAKMFAIYLTNVNFMTPNKYLYLINASFVYMIYIFPFLSVQLCFLTTRKPADNI